MNFQGKLRNDSITKACSKRPISPFLEVGFEKLFDSHMQSYLGKFKIMK